jgi:hypothetical protein
MKRRSGGQRMNFGSVNFGGPRLRALSVLVFLSVLSFAAPSRVSAQFPVPPPDTATPRENAPFDLNGYWVAVVTEDWRYRMVTPEKGDFPGVPANAVGRRVANTWDPAKDEASGNQCKSYGAAAIMRLPERLHISWVDEKTLKVETDAGTQTRVFHFGGVPPLDAAPAWQGYSAASWEAQRPRGFVLPVVAGSGGARPGQEGYLKVITTQLRPGYLRKNGVPYGANATVEEYFDSFKEPNGDAWLIVTTIVTDPQYLDNSYITSSQFKKLPDASSWNPTPCEAK